MFYKYKEKLILGQNPQTFMIPIYSTTVLYDIKTLYCILKLYAVL